MAFSASAVAFLASSRVALSSSLSCSSGLSPRIRWMLMPSFFCSAASPSGKSGRGAFSPKAYLKSQSRDSVFPVASYFSTSCMTMSVWIGTFFFFASSSV